MFISLSTRSNQGLIGLYRKLLCIILFVLFILTRGHTTNEKYQYTTENSENSASGSNKKSTQSLSPDLDPLDLKNGSMIPSVYELRGNRDLKLLFYFYYGSNLASSQPFVLNPRLYSKYIIIQSRYN